MSFILEHTTFGFCWWDLLACIVLAMVVSISVWQNRRLKKQERELEDELSAIYADEALKI